VQFFSGKVNKAPQGTRKKNSKGGTGKNKYYLTTMPKEGIVIERVVGFTQRMGPRRRERWNIQEKSF